MRDLKYRQPYRLQHPRIEEGKRLYNNPPLYFNKVSTVLTKYGIVIVMEMDWATNQLPIKLTIFKTIINGMVYEADLNEQRLSERQLKWLSTHFIKSLLTKKEASPLNPKPTPLSKKIHHNK